MSSNEKDIYVYSDWQNSSPMLIGALHTSSLRGKELISFEYEREYLSSTDSGLIIDPDLSLYDGRQYVPSDKPIFGIFSDSCPDRWGRLLMNRKEAIVARTEGRKPRALTEADYLLGVFDETRMGALRFSLAEGAPFVSFDPDFPVPPWTTLRSLESASLAFEKSDNSLSEKWLNQLLVPGSSLGGARPKASVYGPDGSLWIAKFPSRHDEWNSGAWEYVVHELAESCELNVPEAKLEHYSDAGGTFLVKRFDRNESGRVHYVSAMTMLGRTDGDEARGASYLDIASFLTSSGASPKRDLEELWKRVVFNVAVSNTDDHLRNHGFVLTDCGWNLSPLFDVNPSVYGETLSLNISTDENTMDFDLVVSTAGSYGIDGNRAKRLVDAISGVVRSKWRSFALNAGLSRGEIDDMEPAFGALR